MPRPNPKQGRKDTVSYRALDGTVHSAVVEGGSGSSLNLWVPSLNKANQHKTGIAKRSSGVKQINVWF